MKTQVVLLVMSLWLGYVLAQGEVVKLETGRPYRANFTYTIYDVLNVRYACGCDPFKSEVFATETDKDVKWYFKVYLHPVVEVYLYVSSLPSNVAWISGVSEFDELDVDGQKPSDLFRSNNSVAAGKWFAGIQFTNRSTLEDNPNGHLTVFFDIDATLIYNLKATDGVVPTEVTGRTATKGTNPLECRRKLVRDTFYLINLRNGTLGSDIELKSSNKTVKCHSAILTSRMPLLKLNDADPPHYDFSNELNPVELEDLVSFVYWGTMNHWRQSCLALYKVARKYGIKCLRETCVDAMVGQVKDLNAEHSFGKY